MALNNIEGMLADLSLQNISSSYVNEFLAPCIKHEKYNALTEGQIHEIVRLFNIYCMPSKFDIHAKVNKKVRG